MDALELKLECLKLIDGEPDITIRIAKADMLYQYCVKDKLPCKIGISASELTDSLLRVVNDNLYNSKNTTNSCD